MAKVKTPLKKPELTVNRLAVVLKEEKITNRALAGKLGYEEATVSKWVTNSIQPPLSTFLRIALLINRDLRDLFISSKDMEEHKRKMYLKQLADLAEKSKRTGKKS